MSSSPNPSRYRPFLIALHWFMFVLLAAVFVSIEIRSEFPRGSDTREWVKALHFMLGLTVLLLVFIRLAMRLSSKSPAIVPTPTLWENLLARVVHITLYTFMIFMPIAGWIILSAEGTVIPFFGMELPPLINKNESVAEQVEELHKLFGEVGYYLIGLHVMAALFHHYVRRDNTLKRMSLASRDT